MSGLAFKDESYRIRGAAYDVYKEMGCGFLEAVYQECLAREFDLREISYVEHIELDILYKGNRLIQTYRPDFICYGGIIVEIKAVGKLADEHRAQLHNYLKAAGMKLGFLINFGHYPKIEIERIVK
ncbi:MAG: GxxExxY protein [Acidobacteriota bacterium]|jgi:GxxExxY protein|nr:GxxExxY protein [Acidobacteriota bacterium]